MALDNIILAAICVDIILNLWILSKQYINEFNLKRCAVGNSCEDRRND